MSHTSNFELRTVMLNKMAKRGKYSSRNKAFWYQCCIEYEREPNKAEFFAAHDIAPRTFYGHYSKFKLNKLKPSDHKRLKQSTTTTTIEEAVAALEDKKKITFPGCGHSVETRLLKNIHGCLYQCPTCHACTELVTERELANQALLRTLKAMHGTREFNWPMVNLKISICDVILNLIPGSCLHSLSHDNNWKSFLSLTLSVRHLHLANLEINNKEKLKLRGAVHPHFKFDEKQLLGNPGDGTIGLLSWPTTKGNNFGIVDSLETLSNEDIVDISRSETIRISKLTTEKRPGAAGGFSIPSIDPQYDSKYCSDCTKENRVFIRGPRSKATNTCVRYVNPDTDQVEEYGSVYADPYMYRGDKRAKSKTLKVRESERNKTLAEMKSRLRAMVIIETTKLIPNGQVWGSFIDSIRRAEHKISDWQSINSSLSFFDIVLLEYACGTGEMRNHQALATHIDKNTSHPLESYTLWGKVPMINDNHGYCTSRLVGGMVSGKLSLPNVGVALVSRCGRDAWHLVLNDTMHAADPSRDQYNWSWVHGP